LAGELAVPVFGGDLAACAFSALAACFEEREVDAMEVVMRWESASWTQ
jgi:hypothetical protein